MLHVTKFKDEKYLRSLTLKKSGNYCFLMLKLQTFHAHSGACLI